MPEDSNLHVHYCENLRSNVFETWTLIVYTDPLSHLVTLKTRYFINQM
jgi:hypothetical protein